MTHDQELRNAIDYFDAKYDPLTNSHWAPVRRALSARASAGEGVVSVKRDTLERAITAFPVLRTMLGREGLAGADIAEEFLAELREALANSPATPQPAAPQPQEAPAHTCDFMDGLDDCPACKFGQATCGYHTRNPTTPPAHGDGEGDWYTDEDTGSHHVDWDSNSSRQLSVILKKDGKVGWAMYVDGERLNGPDAMAPEFMDALRKLTARATPETVERGEWPEFTQAYARAAHMMASAPPVTGPALSINPAEIYSKPIEAKVPMSEWMEAQHELNELRAEVAQLRLTTRPTPEARELLAKATALPWEADAGTVRPAPESPDRVTIAYCSGEGSPQGEADAELIAAAVNALPALLHQLAELEAEVASLRARETDLQNALYRWLPHITPFSPEIQGDDCNLLIGLMEPVGPELGESIRQRAIAAERAREEACGLLRECQGNLYHPHLSAQMDALEDRIAAYLAASGGK